MHDFAETIAALSASRSPNDNERIQPKACSDYFRTVIPSSLPLIVDGDVVIIFSLANTYFIHFHQDSVDK